MTLRRRMSAVLTLGLALMLVACGGLPTSGPVNPGQESDATSTSQDTIFLPDRPQAGATPAEIVEGFLRAGSGPTDSWSRAREFLAAEYTDWRPEAGVTIVLPQDRVYESSDEGVVTVSVVAVATVDDRGQYQPVDAGTTTLTFRLAQQDDDQWRITEAPDGIVLDRDVFPSVFHRYSVTYFDPDWTHLVPDVRWFPTINAATRITDALVNKSMSEWLVDAVVSAFPEGVTARAAVPVASGVAEVELSDAALAADSDTLDRMLTQLEASLATAGVSRVEMSVAQAPLDAQSVSTRSTRVSAQPLVLVEDGFGFLSGDELTPIDGLSAVIPALSPTTIQVGPDRDAAAVLAGDGRAVRVLADGSEEVVDDRDGLVAPSIDPAGAVWSVPRASPGEVIAVTGGGLTVRVADAFPGAASIAAMAVSRDGTRMAALVRTGTRNEIWAAGIVRDAEGVPVRLGAPLPLGAVAGTAVDIAWLDDVTVGALTTTSEAGAVFEQPVGGPVTTTVAPAEAVSLAGSASVATMRLRTEDGTVLVRRAANWQESAAGVLVLATQQGTPQ